MGNPNVSLNESAVNFLLNSSQIGNRGENIAVPPIQLKGFKHIKDPEERRKRRMEADKYYEAHDPKKVNQFYKILLNKKVLANGKNLNIAVKKIVLAVRVFLKKPELLLLDEDFLTIDKFRKQTIYNKFWTMDCTIVSILSDMENILLYDRVYLLDKGRVVE